LIGCSLKLILPFPVEEYVERIDLALEDYAAPQEGCPDRLNQAIRHSLLAPGKRLRPLLVLLAAEACGSDSGRAMPAACAVEMVHAYSLVHDDLPAMDDDDLRRGLPTCHVAFDEATAILAGDALLARAFEILAKELQPATVAAKCCASLASAAGQSQMVGGQSDDLACDPAFGTLEFLESIHRRKTGAMIVASLELGGIVAGASPQTLEHLRNYGTNLGLAFQVVDDLLDCEGDESSLGKRTRKDTDREKLTYPGLLGMEASRHRARELTEAACSAAETFSTRGEPLVALARYVLDRNH